MPKFEITKDGKKFEVDAPDMQSAVEALGGGLGQTVEQPKAENGQSFGAGLLDAFTQGAALNFGDEIQAAENALLGRKPGGDTFDLFNFDDSTFGERFDESLEHERNQQAEFAEENPIISPIANIGGAIASGGGLANAGATLMRPGLTLGQRSIRAAAEGLGFGAVAGAGAGTDTESRVEGAGIGAGLGTLGGAVLPSAAEIAGKAIRGIRNQATRLPPSLRGLPRSSVERVSRAVRSDSVDNAALAAGAREIGPEARLLDLGDNLTGQASAIAATPGSGQSVVRNAITARRAGATRRITGAINRNLANDMNVIEVVEDITARQSAAAGPAYRQAFSEGDRILSSPALERLSSSPSVRSAMRHARSTWDDRAIADGFGAMSPQRGMPLTQNLQFWDYTKRVLDDRVRAALRSGNNNRASAISSIARQLREELDSLVPSYAAARDAYAGPAAVKDALEAGSSVFRGPNTPNQLRAQLSDMGASERDAFILGARSHIATMMGNATNQESVAFRELVAKPFGREKLSILIGEEAATELANFIAGEHLIANTGRTITGNSATAGRLAGQAEVPNPAAGSARGNQIGQQSLAGLVARGGDRALDLFRSSSANQIGAGMADILTRKLDDPVVQAMIGYSASRNGAGSQIQTLIGNRAGVLAGHAGAEVSRTRPQGG